MVAREDTGLVTRESPELVARENPGLVKEEGRRSSPKLKHKADQNGQNGQTGQTGQSIQNGQKVRATSGVPPHARCPVAPLVAVPVRWYPVAPLVGT